MTASILIVEDDLRLAQLLAELLTGSGYLVKTQARGDVGARLILAEQPDVVLLDINLPGTDGLDVCRQVRAAYRGRIIILTARGDDIDEVVGLELGADDYLAKPVNPRVLLARVAAVLRRDSQTSDPGVDLCCGKLQVFPQRREVFYDGAEVQLGSADFDLLLLLALNAGSVITRKQIYRKLQGLDYDGLARSIDLRISRLRKALGDDAKVPRLIKTVRGEGYLLVPDL
jgi:DNA-binding response OmpR family regulator